MYRLSNIDEKLLEENETILNDSCNETILPNTVFERISSKRFPKPTNVFAIIRNSKKLKMLSADDSSILFIEDKMCRIQIEECVGVVKKFITLDSRM